MKGRLGVNETILKFKELHFCFLEWDIKIQYFNMYKKINCEKMESLV
jgi:hypothetical protein